MPPKPTGMKRPLHVLIVPPEEFIPPESPVSAIFQYHQALALKALGHRVGVLSVTRALAVKPLLISLLRRLTGRPTFYPQIEGASAATILKVLFQSIFRPEACITEDFDGLSLVRQRLRCWSDITWQDGLDYYADAIEAALTAYIRCFGRPDIVHVHNAWLAGTACVDLLAEKRIPYCLTEHSTYYARDIIPAACYPGLRRVYAAAGVTVAVSPSLAALLHERGLTDGQVRFIPNMLDPGFALPLPAMAASTAGFTFFNVAELTEKKGHALLLRSFAEAFRGNQQTRLVIAGAGGLRSALEHLALELGIGSQTEFTGMLDRESLRARMLDCDAFVLPSLFETFGVVIIEAMACGKPVVATVCGGPEHIVESDTGILVPVGDAHALAVAMRRIFEGAEYDAGAIRRKALEKYGPKAVAEKIQAVYEEILRRS